jgi:hypothetical protein
MTSDSAPGGVAARIQTFSLDHALADGGYGTSKVRRLHVSAPSSR